MAARSDKPAEEKAIKVKFKTEWYSVHGAFRIGAEAWFPASIAESLIIEDVAEEA
jgi:hypothetical protein